MSFLTNFLGAGGREAVEGVKVALINAAPETATKAQLITMEEDVDSAGRVIQDLQKKVREAQAHFDDVNSRYTQLMGAAENLQHQIDDPTVSDDKRASLTASLEKLLPKIEQMAPELDTWKSDLEATRSLLHDAEAAYKEKVAGLTTAKQDLERAKSDVQRANMEEQRAKEREEAARKVAGLSQTSTSGINTAVDAFHKAAGEARDRAAVSNMKSETLRSAKAADAEEDPNVKAAMAAAAGKATGGSVTDRLAALRR